MPDRIKDIRLPRGLSRLAFRLPLGLYHLGLGRLLGNRFVCLTHTGRRSGQKRETVLEVVRYHKETGQCVIASGWGEKSDWVRNISANPLVTFQVGNRRTAGTAERLSPEVAGQELLDYSRRHPAAFRELAAFMGIRLDGTEADTHAAGRMIPMFLLKP